MKRGIIGSSSVRQSKKRKPAQGKNDKLRPARWIWTLDFVLQHGNRLPELQKTECVVDGGAVCNGCKKQGHERVRKVEGLGVGEGQVWGHCQHTNWGN